MVLPGEDLDGGLPAYRYFRCLYLWTHFGLCLAMILRAPDTSDGYNMNNMKIQSVNPRISAIQAWMGQNGANVANAYRVQATSFEEMGAPRGVIEKVLWRIAREEPLMELTTASMLKALDQKNLLREVRKQLKFSKQEFKSAAQNFDKSRHAWIASRIPEDAPDRAALVRRVEGWVKLELAEMTAREAIMEAVDLRVQAGEDFRPTYPPARAERKHLDDLAKQHPGRVYHDNSGRGFLIVKPGEKVELTDKGLQIAGPAAPKPAVPEMTM
jgi:hypothetical protein